MRGRNYPGNYTNPCLTMHQPWASLLVHGIKRVEGRSWPSPIRGRLWIHAASKVPEDATIKAMEDFYREIYAVNGITDLKFPEHYPVSRLVGCIDVVGCVRREELANWEVVPEGVRLEALTDFCWLCERPKKLIIPFEMRGNQGVYNLEKKIYEAAVRGIMPVEGPLPVNFPLPNSRDSFSLKPGSVFAQFPVSKTSQVEKSPGLSAAIAGARAAATQYSKKDHNSQASSSFNRNIQDSTRIDQPKEKSMEDNKFTSGSLHERNNEGSSLSHEAERKSLFEHHRNSGSRNQLTPTDSNQHYAASAKHKSLEATKLPSGSLDERNNEVSSIAHEHEQRSHFEHHPNSGSRNVHIPTDSNQHSDASSKLFATALRGLRLS